MTTDIPHLFTALSYYGLREAPGVADNTVILQMAKDCGFKDYVHDEISWCSLFMNFVMHMTGKKRSEKLDARSWLNVGADVPVPVMGDVCVLWRESKESWKGHVGIYISQDDANYYLLGGNQSDMVNITPFPKDRLLGFRRV